MQEPKDQWLRMEVFDIDMLRPTKLLTGAVSSAVNGREFLGRAMYRMDEVCRNPGQNFTKYHELGKEDWGTPGGPVRGREGWLGGGRVRVACEEAVRGVRELWEHVVLHAKRDGVGKLQQMRLDAGVAV